MGCSIFAKWLNVQTLLNSHSFFCCCKLQNCNWDSILECRLSWLSILRHELHFCHQMRNCSKNFCSLVYLVTLASWRCTITFFEKLEWFIIKIQIKIVDAKQLQLATWGGRYLIKDYIYAKSTYHTMHCKHLINCYQVGKKRLLLD